MHSLEEKNERVCRMIRVAFLIHPYTFILRATWMYGGTCRSNIIYPLCPACCCCCSICPPSRGNKLSKIAWRCLFSRGPLDFAYRHGVVRSSDWAHETIVHASRYPQTTFARFVVVIFHVQYGLLPFLCRSLLTVRASMLFTCATV